MAIPSFWSTMRMSPTSSITTTNAEVSSSTAPWKPLGTRIGDSSASSSKKRTSRMYMRSIVDVNTAASSSAGSLTTSEVGQPSPRHVTR